MTITGKGGLHEESQNMDPNRGLMDIKQQNVWAEELRRADERALKFK